MLRWVRYHFQHLRRWRDYAERVARAAAELAPGSRVYVVGGVAENRVTVLSDIDILVVVPKPRLTGRERLRLTVDILDRAIERHGLPWDAPVEIHVVGSEEASRFLEGRSIEVTQTSPGPHGEQDEPMSPGREREGQLRRGNP